MCGAERRPEIRRERPSEHIPPRSFPSVARSCVRCSDAPCDDNGRRRQEFCSPSASSGVTLARPRVRRAVSRACRHLVAVSRWRISRPPSWELQQLPRTTSRSARRDDGTSNCRLLNAKWLAGTSCILDYTTDSHSPPRDDNLMVRYAGGLWKKIQTTPVHAPTSV